MGTWSEVTGQPGQWVVFFDSDAVRDLASVRSDKERRSLFHVIEKLEALGPALAPPNTKSLKDQPGLFELRPRRGASAVRVIYTRLPQGFVVLAVAADKRQFARSLALANARRRRYSVAR